jgi:hypothetical protein
VNDTQQIDQATVADPASDDQVRTEVDVPEVAADEDAADEEAPADAEARARLRRLTEALIR